MRLILFVTFVFAASSLQASDKDSLAVAKTVTTFVTAFNNFDWQTFRSAFDENASMFHPTWENGRRVRGKNEIEATWLKIFPEFTDVKNTTKLSIDPKDINIQLYDQTAIVTFHLGDGVKSLSRRTFVLVKQKGNWKVVHIHASRVNVEE